MIGEQMEWIKRIKTDCSRLRRIYEQATKQSVSSVSSVFQSIRAGSIIKGAQKNIFSYSRTRNKARFEFDFKLDFEFIDPYLDGYGDKTRNDKIKYYLSLNQKIGSTYDKIFFYILSSFEYYTF